MNRATVALVVGALALGITIGVAVSSNSARNAGTSRISQDFETWRAGEAARADPAVESLESLNRLQRLQRDIARQRNQECLLVVGNPSFCDCLNTSLPAAMEFQDYIAATAGTGLEPESTRRAQEAQKMCASLAFPLSVDEACELLVRNELHEAFDAWTMRFQHVVWCDRGNQGDITVTTTLANGQVGTTDEALMKKMAETRIRALVERKGWTQRYRTLSISVLP